MSVNAVTTGGKRRWKVRWREGTQQRSKTFDRKEDAKLYDAEVTRKRRMGKLGDADRREPLPFRIRPAVVGRIRRA